MLDAVAILSGDRRRYVERVPKLLGSHRAIVAGVPPHVVQGRDISKLRRRALRERQGSRFLRLAQLIGGKHPQLDEVGPHARKHAEEKMMGAELLLHRGLERSNRFSLQGTRRKLRANPAI